MRHLRANETAETGESLGETLGETLERMGEHLSDEGKDMLRRVAVPMAAGLKSHEVGRALGLGPGGLRVCARSCAGAGLTQSCPSGASERRLLCECNTEAKGSYQRPRGSIPTALRGLRSGSLWRRSSIDWRYQSLIRLRWIR